MSEAYTRNKTIKQNELPVKGEYENCVFTNCDFSENDLSACVFTECVFEGCNISLAKTEKTAFRTVKFINCKMLGLRFDTCNPFGLAFSCEGCQLDHSSFYKVKIKNTLFKNSQLKESDFAETDLTACVFDNCDLFQAVFDRAVLEKADLRTAYNYSIDPDTNRVRKAKFSVSGISGLLDKYDIEIEN